MPKNQPARSDIPVLSAFSVPGASLAFGMWEVAHRATSSFPDSRSSVLHSAAFAIANPAFKTLNAAFTSVSLLPHFQSPGPFALVSAAFTTVNAALTTASATAFAPGP